MRPAVAVVEKLLLAALPKHAGGMNRHPGSPVVEQRRIYQTAPIDRKKAGQHSVIGAVSSCNPARFPQRQQGKNMAPFSESRWPGELKAAATDTDVLEVAREYVAFLAKGELEALPPDLKLGPLETCKDVAEWALKLVQSSLALRPDESGVETLRNLSEFFAAASARLSELQDRARRR
jgi:hypothetical protein